MFSLLLMLSTMTAIFCAMAVVQLGVVALVARLERRPTPRPERVAAFAPPQARESFAVSP